MNWNTYKYSPRKTIPSILLVMLLITASLPIQATPYYNLAASWVQKKVVTALYQGSISNFSNGFNVAVGRGAGTGDGMMRTPQAITFDANYFYVSDSINHRISRYNKANGAFAGWLGKIATSPTTCPNTTIGNFTGGWCTGGTSASGSGDGMLTSPSGLVVDNTYLYVADTDNHRISRYNKANGAFAGWIGRIGSSPTTCPNNSTGNFTGGWCTGGTSQGTSPSVSTDGGLLSPRGIAFATISSTTYLFVVDVDNRVSKFNASSGAFVGWIGRINSITPSLGGDPGCNTASSGTFTPGWCTGGTVQLGNGDGMLNSPYGVIVDSGTLYVADTGNHRISKYNASTGAFLGWIGSNAGTFTGGWTNGGTPSLGNGDGMLGSPSALFVDSGFLYVADTNNHRISKYNASSGAFLGWIGSNAGTLTGGWTTGGTPSSGIGNGMLQAPRGLFVDSGYIYVADTLNNRINKYLASTGAFNGALGILGTFQPWSNNNISILNAPGTGDGMMNTPGKVFLDNAGSLYVADTNNHRISKYNASTGAFLGWIGSNAGSFTGGWTSGGTPSPTSGSGDGMLNSPNGLFVDSGTLYVADTNNHRISKYDAFTGAFLGWIGSNAGSFTGGWTSGGTPSLGNGDGMLNSPRRLFVDSGYLYVADTNNHRISRYNKATGSFAGWIGRINSNTPALGGDPGCNTASSGTFTPGWCTGGTSASGSGDGMLNLPKDVIIYNGALYVVDINSRITKYNAAGVFQELIGNLDGNLALPTGITTDGSFFYVTLTHRIVRYRISDGAFAGWIGSILTSPTGGAANCNGMASGKFTPSWCIGGTSQTNTSNGMNFSSSIIFDSGTNSLYVTDSNNHRLIKYKIGP